jgi:serine phosphatase RsbU (regulator of sigma subunit)
MDTKLESIASQGPPLGIDPAQGYHENVTGLEPGNVALLYTDGLYAALDGDGKHSVPDDLGPILPRHAATAQQFVEETSRAVTEGKTLPDDVALVALRRV